MAKHLITFPSAAMVAPPEEMEAVGRASRAVIAAAKAAGVYVFAGGIDASVPAVRVAGDGAVTPGPYPERPLLDGGFAVLELPDRAAALDWAARLAAGCRCAQELRVFLFDPLS